LYRNENPLKGKQGKGRLKETSQENVKTEKQNKKAAAVQPKLDGRGRVSRNEERAHAGALA